MARNDVSFSAIELKARGSEQYINILEQFQASSTFGGMSINEGLFDTGISGFIILMIRTQVTQAALYLA